LPEIIMGKPNNEEMRQALNAAIRMRESGQDPDFVAKALLNLHYRSLSLERVLSATKSYLHAGQSISDHRHLLQAIQTADKASGEGNEDLPILGRDG
jgi:hypothetical protein